jgi:hypothetical protein
MNEKAQLSNNDLAEVIRERLEIIQQISDDNLNKLVGYMEILNHKIGLCVAEISAIKEELAKK